MKKAKKSAITYVLNYAGLIVLTVPHMAPPVMQEVVGMPIVGLLEQER